MAVVPARLRRRRGGAVIVIVVVDCWPRKRRIHRRGCCVGRRHDMPISIAHTYTHTHTEYTQLRTKWLTSHLDDISLELLTIRARPKGLRKGRVASRRSECGSASRKSSSTTTSGSKTRDRFVTERHPSSTKFFSAKTWFVVQA